ncbi:hypothetical protein KLU848_0920 [Kluyveromyces marxianus]
MIPDPQIRLREGIIQGKLGVVRRILKRWPELLENVDSRNGWSSLHYAAFYGRYLTCLHLIQLGHDSHTLLRTYDGDTSIHLAIKNGDEQTVHLLLQHFLEEGLNLRSSGHRKWAPIHIACRADHYRCLVLLLQCGADVMLQDDEGNTGLHVAMEYGSIHCLPILVAAGGEKLVNVKNQMGLDAEQVGNSDETVRKYRHVKKKNNNKSDASFADNFGIVGIPNTSSSASVSVSASASGTGTGTGTVSPLSGSNSVSVSASASASAPASATASALASALALTSASASAPVSVPVSAPGSIAGSVPGSVPASISGSGSTPAEGGNGTSVKKDVEIAARGYQTRPLSLTHSPMRNGNSMGQGYTFGPGYGTTTATTTTTTTTHKRTRSRGHNHGLGHGNGHGHGHGHGQGNILGQGNGQGIEDLNDYLADSISTSETSETSSMVGASKLLNVAISRVRRDANSGTDEEIDSEPPRMTTV